MRLQVTSLQGVPLLEVQGDIDHSNCESVEAALSKVLDDGQPVVLLDFTEVAYLDSGGIWVLLSACRRVREKGWLGVINPNHNVRRLFEIVGLLVDPGFRVFADRKAAEVATGQMPSEGGET